VNAPHPEGGNPRAATSNAREDNTIPKLTNHEEKKVNEKKNGKNFHGFTSGLRQK